MPLVQIDLRAGKPAAYRRALADAVHDALVECLAVPQRDRFQIITEHEPSHMIFDRDYLEVARTEDVVFVRVTLSRGRSTEAKTRFYARLAQLATTSSGLRPQDLIVTLLENTREDWSFGNGEAQYLTMPSDRWR